VLPGRRLRQELWLLHDERRLLRRRDVRRRAGLDQRLLRSVPAASASSPGGRGARIGLAGGRIVEWRFLVGRFFERRVFLGRKLVERQLLGRLVFGQLVGRTDVRPLRSGLRLVHPLLQRHPLYGWPLP